MVKGNKKKLSEKALRKVSGGVTLHVGGYSQRELGEHVPGPVIARRAPRTPAPDAFEHGGPESALPAPIRRIAAYPSVEQIGKSSSDLADRLLKINIPQSVLADRFLKLSLPANSFKSALQAEAHLLDAHGLLADMQRHENAVRNSTHLPDEKKNHELKMLESMRNTLAKLTGFLEQERDKFRVRALADSLHNLTSLSQKNLDHAQYALRDLQKGGGISALSQALRAEVEKTRTALSERLSKLARSAGSSDLALKAMELASRLRELIVHEGAGPRLRFEQSRYLEGARYVGKAKQKLDALAGPAPSLFSKAKEWVMGRTKEEEQAKAFRDVKAKLDSSASTVNQQLKDRYPAVPTPLADTTRFVHSEIEMLESTGLKPVSSVWSGNENLHASVSQLRELTQSRNTAIFSVTGHAMVIDTDPKTNMYRFFDPNVGLYVFNDPQDFAEQVIYFANKNYNASTYSPYEHGLKDGPRQPESLHLGPHRQLLIEQGLLGGDRSLRQGICAAMSAHVARWFLEHPDHTQPITAEMLGLDEFQPQIAAAKRGDALLQMQFLKEAQDQYWVQGRRMADDDQKIKIVESVRKLTGVGGASAALKYLAEQLKRDPTSVFLGLLEKTYRVEQKIEMQNAKDATERAKRQPGLAAAAEIPLGDGDAPSPSFHIDFTLVALRPPAKFPKRR